MGRLLVKLVGFLLLIGVLAVVGYGYLGDLSPNQSEVSQPVNLNAE